MAKRLKFKRILLTVLAIVTTCTLMGCLVFTSSPRPGALLIKYAFTQGAKKNSARLQKHVPQGVSVIADQQYDLNDKDAFLDVYYPNWAADKDTVLPVIVWVHGGGWVSGKKEEVSDYCRILAAKGYVVVAIDYSIAPAKKYPTPLRQTNAALGYVKQNAKRFHIDPSQIFLAGDSAGANIAAQVGNIISSNTYAQLIGILPSISRSQLKGLILYCGPYDAAAINMTGKFKFLTETILWSYSGNRSMENDPYFNTISVINYVDAKYPPCFISVGNSDPLRGQSYQFARKLSSFNVPVDTLFYAADHTPALPHEYQFNLDINEGNLALDRSVAFLNRTVHNK